MHPHAVDVPVARPLGEAYRCKDSDLDAAVGTLLQQFGHWANAGFAGHSGVPAPSCARAVCRLDGFRRN